MSQLQSQSQLRKVHRTEPEGWPSDALMDYRQIAGNSAINFDAILMKLMDCNTAYEG